MLKNWQEWGLELLPDYVDNGQAIPQNQWPKVNGKVPTNEQQTQLAKFTRLVASKMPKTKFAELMKKLQNDLMFTDDPYGRNYPAIFIQMTQWVLETREDTPRNYAILQGGKPEEYTIKDKVTRPITSEGELRAILSSLSVKPMPDIRGRHRLNEVPEMVQLDQVVGGPGIESWAVISTSEGRGFPRVWEFVLRFQSGEASASVAGRDEPIRLSLRLMANTM